MYRRRTPGQNAHYVLTEDAPESFGLFTPNVAVERADQPGYVRVYRRQTPTGEWGSASKMTSGHAASLYGTPIHRDSSD